MKQLKLFFALFAMLALGVTNAWGAEATVYTSNVELSTTGGTKATASKAKISNVEYSAMKLGSSGNAGNFYVNLPANTTSLTLHAAAWNGKNSNKLTLSSETAGVTISPSTAQTLTANSGVSGSSTTYTITPNDTKEFFTFSLTGATSGAKIKLACSERCLIWGVNAETAGGGETPGEGGGEDPETPGAGGSGSIVIKYNSTFTPTLPSAKASVNTSSTAHTVEGLNIHEQGIYKGSSNNYLMFVENKGFLYNTQSLGTITSVSVTYTSGTSTSGKAGVYFGSTEQSTYTTTSNQTIKGQSQTDTWTNTTEGNGFFQLSTSNKNVQITQIEITYTSGGSTETVVSLTDDQLKWSAATAEATMDAENTFPTLTNTLPVPVKYASSTSATATIDATTGAIILVAPGTTTISAIFEGGEVGGTKYAAKTVDYTLTVKPAPLEPIAGGVIDILDNVWSGLTTSDYATVAAKTAANTGHSNAQYTAQCAGSNSSIQLRSNNSNSGIVSTVSGGLVKRVEIEWNDATSTGRTLNIYGSNTPYTNPTDLYDTNKDGDKLGTIVKGTSTYLEISKDYRYIGIRSASGAMYLAKVTITWLPINSKVSIDDAIQHGSVSVTGATDLNAVAAGTVLTLDNTPATGYKLTAYDVYKTDDATTKVTVTDGEFIMPEFDVTISATFEAAKTLTGLDITTPATQTTFWQGEAFNHDGLKVTAHFDGADDEDVTSKITVTGSTATAGTQTVTVSYKEGEVTKDATYTITIKAIPNTKETAYTVADAFDIIDKLGDTDKMYITGFVSQADLVQSTIDQYKNADYWISADGSTNGQQLEAYRGKYLDNADFTSVNQIMVGDEVIIYGKLTKYGSTYEFAAGNYLVSLKRDKQQPELSYTTTEYNINLGDAFTAPTLNNPHTLAVTYSSNNEDVATVAADGAVTIKAAGTVTITASFAGDDTYVTGSASYTINITDPNVSEATFVAGTDKSDTKSISKNGITVEFADGSFSRDDNYRCYAGKSMTISYADGNITKIVIECTANDGAEYGPGQFTTETATYSYSGKVGTWTGEANSVTFTNIKQVRMTAITVYYKQDNRAETGLAWDPATVSLTVGDAFTAPKFSNPNNLAVSFESSNTELATVDNAGAISLVSGKTGTATITATYAGNETYKAAEVTCVITVNPKSETVVILAQLEGQWYAMTGAYVSGKTNVLAAIPVEYINGTLYNVAEADKVSIEWQRSMNGNKATFKNGDNYLTGGTSGTDLTLKADAFEWDYNGVNYLSGNATTKRTFLYCVNTQTAISGFKNYAISNAGSVKNNNDGTTESYSSTPEVVAPVYATATIYTRSVTSGNFGTICLPYGSSNYSGAEFFEVAGKETGKVTLNSVKTLVAGTPYIFQATDSKISVVYEGEAAEKALVDNGLHGTFEKIDDVQTTSAGKGYIIALMPDGTCALQLCGANCWLEPNRAYLVIDEINKTKSPMPGCRRISMDVQGENVETGVEDLFSTDAPVKLIENGQLIIIRDGVKYNIQGQKL